MEDLTEGKERTRQERTTLRTGKGNTGGKEKKRPGKGRRKGRKRGRGIKGGGVAGPAYEGIAYMNGTLLDDRPPISEYLTLTSDL